jgi:hypothetical protein
MRNQKARCLQAKRTPTPDRAELVCRLNYRTCAEMLRMMETQNLSRVRSLLRQLGSFNVDQICIHQSHARELRIKCKRIDAETGEALAPDSIVLSDFMLQLPDILDVIIDLVSAGHAREAVNRIGLVKDRFDRIT